MKKGGCSAFCTHNENGDNITCRNYDLYHKDADGKVTGLNVILHLSPKGKYESINVADACWLEETGIPYYSGALDDGKTNLTPVALLPYICMDGMNETGFTASILALDIKEGEEPVNQNEKGKDTIIETILMRYMIDNCATVEEAIDMAKTYNVINTFNQDYHLFVSDAQGNSAVLEWRHNKLTVTYNDAVTNFYVGSDDAEDCYIAPLWQYYSICHKDFFYRCVKLNLTL